MENRGGQGSSDKDVNECVIEDRDQYSEERQHSSTRIVTLEPDMHRTRDVLLKNMELDYDLEDKSEFHME